MLIVLLDPSLVVIFSIKHVIWVSVEVLTLQADSSLAVFKVTRTALLSTGKPVPLIVRVSPPRAFANGGLTEVTVRAMLMSATPLAKLTRPLLSLISALWSPALGACLSVHEMAVSVKALDGVESTQLAPPKLTVTPVIGRDVPVTCRSLVASS